MATPVKSLEIAPPRRWALLGARLRELRTQRGLSLKQVSERSGIARSTLYKVENSGMSLTYDNLIRLSEGLQVDIAELFQGSDAQRRKSPAHGRRAVGGAEDGFRVSTANYDYAYLCNELRQKQMVPMLGLIKARSLEDFGPMLSHPGEEFSYVLRGSMEVHSEIYAPVRLEQGQYIYLDSMMPHAYIAVGGTDALVLCVCSSPDADLAESLPRLLAEADANRAIALELAFSHDSKEPRRGLEQPKAAVRTHEASRDRPRRNRSQPSKRSR
jgi:transcriptional regulator with XRE-family HTH domain